MSRKYFYVVSPWILRENKVLHHSRFVGGDLEVVCYQSYYVISYPDLQLFTLTGEELIYRWQNGYTCEERFLNLVRKNDDGAFYIKLIDLEHILFNMKRKKFKAGCFDLTPIPSEGSCLAGLYWLHINGHTYHIQAPVPGYCNDIMLVFDRDKTITIASMDNFCISPNEHVEVYMLYLYSWYDFIILRLQIRGSTKTNALDMAYGLYTVFNSKGQLIGSSSDFIQSDNVRLRCNILDPKLIALKLPC